MIESATPQHREPTFVEAAAPLLVATVLLTVGYGILGINVEILLITSAVFAGLIGLRLGFRYDEIQAGINNTLHKSLTALLIVTIVGALIAAWIACGTIPMLIYYGLKIITPQYFLVTSCLVCSIVSLITGTSWGTAGTIGVALMGISHGLGISPAIAAGSIIAGSYFGDKLSLFSDTTNLAPVAAGTNIYDHVAHMIWTTAPAYLIGLVIYLIIGIKVTGDASNTEMELLSTGLAENFNIVGLVAFPLLLPPIITLGAALLKKPVIPSMLLSCAVAWILAVSFQYGAPISHPSINQEREVVATSQSFSEHLSNGNFQAAKDSLQLKTWNTVYPLWAMVRGYQAKTSVPVVNTLLSRGGMLSMMNTFLIALTAFGFAGTMSVTGMLKKLLSGLLVFANSTGRLILSTSISCMIVAFCTGSSYLAILLPGELFSSAYRARGLAAKNLSRTTEDCGTVIVPLIPWSVAGAYMSGILGVPVLSYAPWAFMCYLGMFFAILYGFTGFKIAPRLLDDETQPGS